MTIAAGLALILGSVFLMKWHSSPQYGPLYTNLAPSDASAIVDKLNQQACAVPAVGRRHRDPRPAEPGVLDAHHDERGRSAELEPDRLRAARQDGVTTSQFQQQIDYQLAIEGELDNTIQSISGVSAASVHLAIPQQNVYNDGTQNTTASVLLTTAPGATLSSGQVQSVVYLVSSSVPGPVVEERDRQRLERQRARRTRQ